MDAKTAQSLFSKMARNKSSSSKEDVSINFKSANDSLVKKNLLYKQQLTQCAKTIEKLREENVALRQRNQELMDGDLEGRIELIVEQRVKSRLAHAAALNKRLVQVLQQTGSELTTVFADIQADPISLVSRRAPKAEINLERVDESPVRRMSSINYDEGMEDKTIVNSTSYPSTSIQNIADGTPRKKNPGSKGRRSELFQSLNCDVSMSNENLPPTAPAARRAPMFIAPSATPSTTTRKAAPQSSSRRFKKPSTPAPAPLPNESELSDTIQVRRQRSAKMNIKSMKEPSLGSKLRRPGKHDEPMPFIDTFF